MRRQSLSINAFFHFLLVAYSCVCGFHLCSENKGLTQVIKMNQILVEINLQDVI